RALRWISLRAAAFVAASPKTASRTTWSAFMPRNLLRRAVAVHQMAADLRDQRHDVERLLHRPVDAHRSGFLSGDGIAAQKEDGKLLEFGPQSADHFVVRHARHMLIE